MSRARFLVALVAAASTLAACAISFDGYELDDAAGAGASGASTSASSSSSVGAGAPGGAGSGASSSGPGSGGGGAGNGGNPSAGGGPAGGGPVGGGGAGQGGGGTCPSNGGGMVLVQAATPFCIDQTEVTQTAYNGFLMEAPNPADQPAPCTGQSFTPVCADWQPFNTGNRPVNCVDWCDADAYCKFFEKRLCGRIGGGAIAPGSDSNDAAQSEWFNACSNGGADAYPYGPAWETGFCNDISGAANPLNVGSNAACANDQGVVDLSGNVREWDAACSGGECLVRGGCWLDGPSSNPHTARCSSPGTKVLTENDDYTGFRCCADPL